VGLNGDGGAVSLEELLVSRISLWFCLILQKMDLNGDGAVSLDEFLACCLGKKMAAYIL
jgi:EF hand